MRRESSALTEVNKRFEWKPCSVFSGIGSPPWSSRGGVWVRPKQEAAVRDAKRSIEHRGTRFSRARGRLGSAALFPQCTGGVGMRARRRRRITINNNSSKDTAGGAWGER